MKKEVKNTKKSPTPGSKTTKQREARGFTSVEKSTRKGRRSAKRLAIACTINGQVHEPGTKVVNRNNSKNTMTAGGSVRHH